MIKLRIIKKEDKIEKEDKYKKYDYFTEEIIDNVYDFDFDFKIGNLIIKCLDDEKAVLKVISIESIQRIIGYEVN